MKTQTDSHEVKANAGLFEGLGEPSELQVRQAQAQAASKRSQGAPRVLEPNGRQVELRVSELESLLGEDHRARLVCGATSSGRTWEPCSMPSRPGVLHPGGAPSTHASCSPCGCTPRWTAWAADAKSRA